jgi:putative ABC transport system permease protein
MSLIDLLRLAAQNLRRTGLRACLTTGGVVIGIGALVSMVSLGTGMQRNAATAFQSVDGFTLLTIMPAGSRFPLPSIPHSELEAIEEEEAKSIDDATVEWLNRLPDVILAYPEISIPAKINLGDRDVETVLKAVPSGLESFRPFSDLEAGRFFSSHAAFEIILSSGLLNKLGVADVSSAPGRELEAITVHIDREELAKPALVRKLREGLRESELFAKKTHRFEIAGVFGGSSFGRRGMGSAYIPLETGKNMEYLRFRDVFDLMRTADDQSQYDMALLHTKDAGSLPRVADAIRNAGYETFSLLEEFQDLQRNLMIFEGLLAAVGFVALVVAGFGIVNTMVMSVLERFREIGIMKAVGATKGDIKKIFIVESGAIGLVGGSAGVVLGWIVTRIAEKVGNHIVAQHNSLPLSWFFIPWWLILGAIAFALLVSLLAALYPAARAATVDPIDSLRRE